MKEFINDSKYVYNYLEDEISKKIFLARMNWYITGDGDYITRLPAEYRNLSSDTEMLLKSTYGDNRLIIFGAGSNGKTIVKYFKNMSVTCFVDNYRYDDFDVETGLAIYSFEQYKEKYGLAETKFIISLFNSDSKMAIYNQLIENGVKNEDIIQLIDWRNNSSQYFDFFTPEENESFVDCGCFDGSTAFRFAAWCSTAGYDKIWAFEPDEQSYQNCKKTLSVLGNCEVYPFGISDKPETVSFEANGREDARIVKENNAGVNVHTINTITLDEFLKDQKVTFIKMDIEGAEFDALVGAKNIIQTQKPKLAISIYHDIEHIVSIPKLLLQFRPDYKLYIRHYSLVPNETILYAK